MGVRHGTAMWVAIVSSGLTLSSAFRFFLLRSSIESVDRHNEGFGLLFGLVYAILDPDMH